MAVQEQANQNSTQVEEGSCDTLALVEELLELMVPGGKKESRVFGSVATGRLPAQAPGNGTLSKDDSIRILRQWCQERG